jgi:hypothetical protein
MDKLKELLIICKASVSIQVNNHKDYYQTVADYIEDQSQLDEGLLKDIGEENYAKMVETDTIVEIQAYPDTPVGSYLIYHYNIDMAIDQMLNIIKKQR